MSRFSSLIALALAAGAPLLSLPTRSSSSSRSKSPDLERIRKAHEKRDRKNAKRMRP